MKIKQIEYNSLLLFNPIPDTELIKIIEKANDLLNFKPEILVKIKEDQELHAKEKKKIRIADKNYFFNKNQDLPSMKNNGEINIDINELELKTGKERMKPQVVYLFMMLRGYFESVTSKRALCSMTDSITLSVLLDNWHVKMPGATTILENINCISNSTRNFIHNAQIDFIVSNELDDFKEIWIDSTHVEANSEWPTDSKMLYNLLSRATHNLRKLSIFDIEGFKEFYLPYWLKKLYTLNFKINLIAGKANSKKEIKKLYRQVLKTAQKAHDYLIKIVGEIENQVRDIDLPPSLKVKLLKIWDQINNDLHDTVHVLYYTENRVMNGIILKSTEKILSISDRTAAFIKKGNRNPVIGYKPQLSRSGKGFIPGIIIPTGNTSDSSELVPMAEQIIERTTNVMNSLGVDDGYSSIENRKALLEKGIKIVSIGGAKGKKITPLIEWESETYQEIRNKRSTVESLIFTLKYLYNFGHVRRRGIEAVRAELVEKIIVFNFERMVFLETNKKKREAA